MNNNLQCKFKRIGIPDMFIEHGNVNQLLEEIHITTEDIVKLVKKLINQEDTRYKSS